MIGVLFVCLGNICRSPMAEAVFRQQVDDAGLADQFEIDSAARAAGMSASPTARTDERCCAATASPTRDAPVRCSRPTCNITTT